MTHMGTKRKQRSGGAKLRAAGKKAVLLGLTPEQHTMISQAAQIEMRSVAGFITWASMNAAQESVVRRETARGLVRDQEGESF